MSKVVPKKEDQQDFERCLQKSFEHLSTPSNTNMKDLHTKLEKFLPQLNLQMSSNEHLWVKYKVEKPKSGNGCKDTRKSSEKSVLQKEEPKYESFVDITESTNDNSDQQHQFSQPQRVDLALKRSMKSMRESHGSKRAKGVSQQPALKTGIFPPQSEQPRLMSVEQASLKSSSTATNSLRVNDSKNQSAAISFNSPPIHHANSCANGSTLSFGQSSTPVKPNTNTVFPISAEGASSGEIGTQQALAAQERNSRLRDASLALINNSAMNEQGHSVPTFELVINPLKDQQHYSLLKDAVADEGSLIRIGYWGERYIFHHLQSEFSSCSIEWVNEEEESGKPYDFIVKNEHGSLLYCEVKTTTSSEKRYFELSLNELDFSRKVARVENQNYRIYRVVVLSTESVHVMALDHPSRFFGNQDVLRINFHY